MVIFVRPFLIIQRSLVLFFFKTFGVKFFEVILDPPNNIFILGSMKIDHRTQTKEKENKRLNHWALTKRKKNHWALTNRNMTCGIFKWARAFLIIGFSGPVQGIIPTKENMWNGIEITVPWVIGEYPKESVSYPQRPYSLLLYKKTIHYILINLYSVPSMI